MSVILYKHNKETYEKILHIFEDHNKVGVVQPTGTGKSFLILKWMEDNESDTFVILSPSVEIFNQLERYAAEMNVSINEKVSFITYEKLNMMEESEVLSLLADKIVLDEFHRAGAEQWGKSIELLLNNNANAKVLGLTATPVRYLDDARNMADELFDGNIAREMTLGEAVAEGILPIPEYVPVWYDYDDMLTEYQDNIASIEDSKKRKELEETLQSLKNQLENSYGAKDIFKAHMPTNHGKWIVFCRDTEHIDEIIPVMKDWLSDVNTNIHSYVSIAKRNDKDAQLTSFMEDNDNSAVKLLYTVDRFNEGVHIDGVDGVIMLRPTVSPIIYLQQMGRALSSKGTRKPVIFDMVNNYQNVMVDYGNGEENVFEREIHIIINELPNSKMNDIAFKIYESQIEFEQLLQNINTVFSYDLESVFIRKFELLKEFMELYKREPYQKEIYKGIKLGTFCWNKREAFKKGKLAKHHELKLREIGFSFDNPTNTRFNNNLRLLKEFIEIYKRVPHSCESYKGINLGTWCIGQRQMYKEGRLPIQRKEALQQVGFCVENQREIRYNENIALLEEFIQLYGREPNSREIYKDVNLGSWCGQQKVSYNKGTLSKERELQLIKAGFSFTVHNDFVFANNLALLKEFMEIYGREPNSQEIYKDVSLGSWCYEKRRHFNKGRLSKKNEKALRDIGFTFELKHDVEFNIGLQLLKEFIEKNHREPSQRENYKNFSLGRWCHSKRCSYKNGSLSLSDEEKLKAIGFTLTSPKEEQFYKTFNLLKEFMELNGREPHHREIYKNVKLGRWCGSKRDYYKKGTLLEYQKKELESIGFRFE